MEHIERTIYGDRLVTHFSNLCYLAVETTFGPNVHDLIVRIVRVATKLEMLSLSYYDNCTTLKSLDLIISELTKSCCASNLHLLVAYSRFDSIDMGLFSVSYRCLKSLIDVMSVTAVAHRQVVRFEGTTIVCNDIQELNELLNLHVISKKAPIIEMYSYLLFVM